MNAKAKKIPLARNKSGAGRPPKLQPDAETLDKIRGLGQIQATTKECAAFLNVTEPTFLKFKADHAEVAEALDRGKGIGCISLRRTQFKLADKNAAMAIFLGKNYLEQTDRLEQLGAVGMTVAFHINGLEVQAKKVSHG